MRIEQVKTTMAYNCVKYTPDAPYQCYFR